MIKVIFIIVCSVSILFADISETYMGYKVIKMPFKIADNQNVELRLTDAGAIPAENEDYKIEYAGLTLAPSPENQKIPNLFFGFAFTNKSDANVSEIIVEEVFPSENAIVIYEDKNPHFIDKRWVAKHVHPVIPSQEITPWLYNSKGSIYIFRFTIKKNDGRSATLLQLTWFSRAFKSSLLLSLEKYK